MIFGLYQYYPQYEKKREVGSLFVERNVDVLALSETKIKGKREEWFTNVLGQHNLVGVRAKAKQGVAVLLEQELWECVSVRR